jgi:cytochrome c
MPTSRHARLRATAAPATSGQRIGCAVLVLGLVAPAARADSQLAFDKGCYNCHSGAPKAGAPSFAELAARYAKQRGGPGFEQAVAQRLRGGSMFGHIAAHEQLSQDDAERLVRWLAAGAR